jgi:hypothetical protein
MKSMMSKLFFLSFIMVIWCSKYSLLFALTTLFVDPNWNGVERGTALEPWKFLSSNSWYTINELLRTTDVTVYFSARPASSDTGNCYDVDHDGNQDGIELTKKITDSNFSLTFDGGSYFRTGNNIKWSVNNGKSMCKVKHFNSQNANHAKYNHIVITKFRIEKNDNGKAIAICGDFWTISDCDIYHTSQVHDGPLILLVPVADKQYQGSNYYAPPCTDIVLKNNKIHNSCGELIYLGGGGCLQIDSTGNHLCSGFPSHKNITITGNELYEGGIYGQEGDGIDCKGGLSNVIISGNEIHDMHAPAYRAITMKGQRLDGVSQQAIIEKNYIHHCTGLDDAAIAIVNNWGTPGSVDIRNNIIAFNDKSAIKIYGGKTIRIIYNTLFNNRGAGVIVEGGRVTIKNNLLIENDNRYQLYFKNAAVICSNNGFSGEGFTLCSDCTKGLSSKIFFDVSAGNFFPSNGKRIFKKGIPDTNFSDDFSGKRRDSVSWTLGAIERFDSK